MESMADFEKRQTQWRREGRELTRAYKRDKWITSNSPCQACDTPTRDCLHNDGCCPTCIEQDFLSGALHRWKPFFWREPTR